MKTYRLSAHIDAHNKLDAHRQLKQLAKLMPNVEFILAEWRTDEYVMSVRGDQTNFFMGQACTVSDLPSSD